ncbi:MAG: hypothetical protein QE487_00370 [Fluviicola sp.]|nr:hypothetical protein [Fluviicola sp.]
MSNEELLDSNPQPTETAWVIYLVGLLGSVFCLVEIASLAYPWYLSMHKKLSIEPTYWVLFPALLTLVWMGILFKKKAAYFMLLVAFVIRTIAFLTGHRFSISLFPAFEIVALILLSYQLHKMKRYF